MAAAGSGTRLGAAQPKALVPLAGQPLVARAVANLAAGGVDRVVVIIPDGRAEQFAAVLADAPIPVELVVGGAERQESVRRGLASAPDDCVLLVHDAARPLVPAEVVAQVIAAVRDGAVAVTPVVPVTDSIRQVVSTRSTVVDRATLRAVQTPQGFDLAVLRRAHVEAEQLARVATDDAALCELAGHPVTLVEGSPLSFKITTAVDLTVAEALLG